MSCTLEFTERARAALKGMDTWLQEETLDEIDQVAASPPLPTNRRLAGAVVHDFVRDRGLERFYVFITVIPRAATDTLRVSEIGWWSRPT